MTPLTVDGYEIPALTVDTVVHHDTHVLLIRRGHPPFAGMWALPGGFVDYNETVQDAARRETHEESGIDVVLEALLGVYSDPERDPRHHTVSVVFLARPADPDSAHLVHGGSDADAAHWFAFDDLPELAFDHPRILEDARRRLHRR